jgi:tRNA-5-methyluridine54 2-sulfurtransferase
MRQHKLALCDEHFLEWVPEQTQRFIEKYKMFTPDERILVAVSGGKDSLSLWDVLLRLGYKADGMYIGLGIDGGVDYSNQSHEMCDKFLSNIKSQTPAPALRSGASAGVSNFNSTFDHPPLASDFQSPTSDSHWEPTLHMVDIAQVYGETVPNVAARTMRGRAKPCSVCGLIKRHVMNRVARDGGYDVLATGHNLDDEVAVLFGNTLTWNAGYLVRQAPVLPADKPGLARKVKPFCRLYERETTAYALVRGIEYIYDECPFAEGSTSIAHKEILNQMEKDSPGVKLQFYLNFLRAREQGLFAEQAARVELNACEKCGQPTSAPGLCAFCRLWEKKTSEVSQTSVV